MNLEKQLVKTADIHAITKYMEEIGWTIPDLHRHTIISVASLHDILSGMIHPTYGQLMHIINKIILQFPQDRHWEIYHTIMVKPITEGQNND